MANYYNLIRDCIHSVRDEVQGKHGTIMQQLHERQCSYVLEELSTVLESLQSRLSVNSSLKRHDDVHRRNVVLLHLHGAVKRAQNLVHRCCIKNLSSSWLAAAMTLVNITEEVIAILLDLHQWTTLLEIVLIGAVAREGSHEIEMRTKPLEAGEVGSNHHHLLEKNLHSSNHPLQIAALQDREDLVKKIAYSGKHTSHEDPDYVLGVYLESQLNHSEQQRPESIQQRLRDSYTYLGVLGYGGSGMVLEVKWLGQQIALKISDTIDEPEATMLKQLHHPNIIQFFHYCEDPTIQRSYIFMDRMSTNLQKHIKNLKVSMLQSSLGPRSKDLRPFSLPVAIDVMGQVAEAMRHLHDKNLAHRDLKTSNILVKQVSDSMLELHTQGYLEVKLADFGLPKAYPNSSIFEELSRKRGTTVYGAPEIYGSEQNSDMNFPLKADVWSFGMICSEILTGIEPFVDEKPIKTLHDRISHNGVRPSLPQDCPSYLRICITRCWTLDPARRPSFSELCGMLRHAKLLSLELGQLQDRSDQISNYADSTLARGMRTIPPRSTFDILEQNQEDSLQGSISDLDVANKIKPNDWYALQRRGILTQEKGDLEAALKDLDNANKAKPDVVCTLQNRGIVKFKLKDLKGALVDLDAANEIVPNNWCTLYNRGIVRKELDDMEGAHRDLVAANKVNPHSSNTLVQRALVKINMMDLEGALADLNAADMVKPENWYTLKIRGIVKKQLGDMEGAQNDLVASIMCKSKKSGR